MSRLIAAVLHTRLIAALLISIIRSLRRLRRLITARAELIVEVDTLGGLRRRSVLFQSAVGIDGGVSVRGRHRFMAGHFFTVLGQRAAIFAHHVVLFDRGAAIFAKHNFLTFSLKYLNNEICSVSFYYI